MDNLFKPTYLKRFIFFILTDAIVFSLAYFISFSIRFSTAEFFNQYEIFRYYLPIFIFTKIAVFLVMNVYSLTWKYFSFKEAAKIFVGITFAQAISYIILYFMFKNLVIIVFSRSIFFLDYFISIFLILSLRGLKRAFLLFTRNDLSNKKNIVIYGAGDGGEKILREIIKKESPYRAVAILDDDKSKWRTSIHDIYIEGGLKEAEKVLKKHNAESVLIAIPSISKSRLKQLYDHFESINIKDIKILPTVDVIIEGRLSLSSVKNVDITDLLGRESVKLDNKAIGSYLAGMNVLITGACGSIGSEIVNQVLKYNAKNIYALDIDETELFYLENRIMRNYGKDVHGILCDVRDTESLNIVFEKNSIDVVFHAAALKHVPMCERFPEEAVKTNILGTENLVNLSKKFNVSRFLFISTDKAVNPSSIMGGTKRIAEYIVTSSSNGKTIFSCVRFGNVLGSRGSVIPIFEEQIKSGGPVTITHPDMKRYFMTTHEAVQLVLESCGGAVGGEVFILDMGESVLIKDLAENMIKMLGYIPHKDIKIIYTGKRKGEKLFEELLRDEEGFENTRFEKIHRAIGSAKFDEAKREAMTKEFSGASSYDEIKILLKKYIFKFKDEE